MSDQAMESTDTVEMDSDAPFPPEIQEVLNEALELHRELPEAQRKVENILARRRAKVLKLRSMGVSGYKLAKVFEVSQTTIGNWCSTN